MSEARQRGDVPVMLQERPIRGGVNATLAHDSAARHVSGEAIFVDELHKGFEQRTANALPQHNGRKLQVADQISAPHAARFTA